MTFWPLHRGRALLSALFLWLLFLILLFVGATLFSQHLQGALGRYIYGAIGTAAALIATAVLLRVNRCAWVDAGLRWDGHTILRFLAGLAAGLALISVVLLLVFFGTGIRPVLGNGLSAATVLALGALLPLALMEEIAFRGYPFNQLQRHYGIWVSQIATALAFAAYHVLNGWPLVMSLVGPGAWAFVFGIAAARSGGIALPTGLHFGLNVAQALVGLGTATASIAVFTLTDAQGVTGDALAERMTPAGLAAQVLFLGIALWLTYRLAQYARQSHKVGDAGRSDLSNG